MNEGVKNTYIIELVLALVVLCGVSVLMSMPDETHAQESPLDSVNITDRTESVFSAYQDLVRVPSMDRPEPSVVEVPLPDVQSSQPAVFNSTEQEFIPSYTYVSESENLTPLSIRAETAQRSYENLSALNDNNRDTYQDFELPDSSSGEVTFAITAEEQITTQHLMIALSPHVALPDTISVRAGEDDRVIVAERSLEDTSISFPQAKAQQFRITFTYSQPLRIAELNLVQNNPNITAEKNVRFLAQPDHDYWILYNPDRRVQVPIQGESPNLRDDEGVNRIDASSDMYLENPEYTRADIDGDGVVDIYDNCVRVSNPEQIDKNNNGRGDACDDFDRDGVINSEDNCPDTPNSNQADVDDDGVGDVCDNREDRITERYKWVPWVGISLAGLVLIILVGYTLYEARDELSDLDE